jgi:hypothetical protein
MMVTMMFTEITKLSPYSLLFRDFELLLVINSIAGDKFDSSALYLNSI